NRLVCREIQERGFYVFESLIPVGSRWLIFRMLGRRLDVDQLTIDGDRRIATQQCFSSKAEWLVVEDAAIADGPCTELDLSTGHRLGVFLEERFPLVNELFTRVLVVEFRKAIQHFLNVTQSHRLEGERKRRRAARRKCEKGIVLREKVVAVDSRCFRS